MNVSKLKKVLSTESIASATSVLSQKSFESPKDLTDLSWDDIIFEALDYCELY